VEGRRDVVTIWVAADGRIAVDGAPVELQQVGGTVGPRAAASPRALVAIRADEGLRFGSISDLLQQLRGAGVLAVTFSTRLPDR
jgi:biopolymer transport protein ExbD